MTLEERQLLQGALDKLVAMPTVYKDPEADGMIARAFAARPDAPYITMQHLVMMNETIRQLQGRIEALEREAASRAAAAAPSAGLFGTGGQPAAASQQPAAPSQGSSFLRQTASSMLGVAGGMALFEGISSLFSHRADETIVIDQSGGNTGGASFFDDGGASGDWGLDSDFDTGDGW